VPTTASSVETREVEPAHVAPPGQHARGGEALSGRPLAFGLELAPFCGEPLEFLLLDREPRPLILQHARKAKAERLHGLGYE
jgi:hypothetical protein